jgi:hypothetical protein
VCADAILFVNLAVNDQAASSAHHAALTENAVFIF